MNEEHQSVESDEIDVEALYGSKKLRWYQIAARNEVVEHLVNGFKRIVVELPTGAGKTLTFAASMSYPPLREALGVHCDRPLRVLFIALNHRLLTQAEQTFVGESNIDLILQSAFSDIPEKVIKEGWDITVIDECHHESITSIQYKLEKLGNHPILGLTATVDRADGTLIKFEKFVKPISREQAVKEGFLAETDVYSFVDAPEKDKTIIIKDILNDYHSKMDKTIVFMRTKKEAAIITEHIRSLGHNPIFLDSQSAAETEGILNDFSKGKYDFVVNCNRLGEGIDVKGCTSVLLGRTIGSYPLLNQIVGRASRPDSDCRIWEIINPLSGQNLDTTVVVGVPKTHKLIYRKNNKWIEEKFDYTSQFGITTFV
jgi:superfamily II DNA or RNA helicase